MIVYTALMGRAERLYSPLRPGSGNKFICFTEQPIRSPGWKMCRPQFQHADCRLAARWHKLHPHVLFPKEVESVWIDANMELLVDPCSIATRARGHELVGLVHPKNDTVTEEAVQIHKNLHFPLELLEGMLARYKEEGFIQPNHVTSTGFLYRRHTPTMATFHEIWWQEVMCCVRDQMSVDFSAWKAGIVVRHFDGHFRNNDFFQYFTHGGKKAKILSRKLTQKYGRLFLK